MRGGKGERNINNVLVGIMDEGTRRRTTQACEANVARRPFLKGVPTTTREYRAAAASASQSGEGCPRKAGHEKGKGERGKDPLERKREVGGGGKVV